MSIKEELITPALAQQYLNVNPSNRKLREGHAEGLSADMAAGRWTQCAMPIVFYADGEVADGQHRLWAIVDSGIPQTFFVLRGFPRPAGLNIDTGLPRTLVDNAKISGEDNGLSNELISVARSLETGERSATSHSNAQKLEMVERHREACAWAIANGPRGKGLRNGMVLAAIARAWYVERNTERLRRYCEVLGTGFSEGKEESAAIAMRNYLLTKGGVSNNATLWRDTFMKMQNSIHYFMRSKPLTVIKGISEEPYPLTRGQQRKLAA